MNKTLLLILCDFLLLNLLALTNWQSAAPKAPGGRAARDAARGAAAEKPATETDDVISVMRLALDDERARREQLARRLETARGSLETARAELERTREEKQRVQLEAEEKIEALTSGIEAAERERADLKAVTETLQTRVETERKDRVEAQTTTTKLAENVGELAKGSAAIVTEFKAGQGVTPNAIARLFFENRLALHINASRPGLFGLSGKRREAVTVIAGDGGSYYALAHIETTPFSLTEKPRDWTGISGEFRRGARTLPIRKFSFLEADPRIIAVPLAAEEVARLGYSGVYRLAADPFKFSEGVFINKRQRGVKVTFEFNPDTPGYAEIVVNADPLSKNPNAFDNVPESGDLIFSANAEVLGIMVNNDYCVLIGSLKPGRTLETGEPAPPTAEAFAHLQARYKALPRRLR
ncbi:MAG: hypothetical protein LBR12_02270 [Opitutaceae bacterium]|jgi:hypothetical protein|nr:hypothetical protein [Opitutaceae bacterium]